MTSHPDAPRATHSGFIARLEAGQRQTIVAYGTSLTQGGAWPALLQMALDRKYPGLATVVNSGEGGQWSGWGLEHLDERVLQKHPDAVLVEFAVNDAAVRFNATPEISRQNLEVMLDRILQHAPACQLILLTMNCCGGDAEARRGHRTASFYQAYREVAKTRGLLMIDTYPLWKDLYDRDFAEFERLAPDLLHPTREGAERITMPAIASALWPKPNA